VIPQFEQVEQFAFVAAPRCEPRNFYCRVIVRLAARLSNARSLQRTTGPVMRPQWRVNIPDPRKTALWDRDLQHERPPSAEYHLAREWARCFRLRVHRHRSSYHSIFIHESSRRPDGQQGVAGRTSGEELQ
jgi:hypothetical protein